MQKESVVLALIATAAGSLFLLFVIPDIPSMVAYYPKLFIEMISEGYLTGTVYGPDGAPFDNFKLIIYSGDVLIKVVHTDANGNYGLPLNIGDYGIVTSQGTYDVSIESGKTTTLNIPA